MHLYLTKYQSFSQARHKADNDIAVVLLVKRLFTQSYCQGLTCYSHCSKKVRGMKKLASSWL